MTLRRRRALALVVLFTLSAPAAPAADAGLEQGLQQVREGDFEAAVTTLEAASRRLELDLSKKPDAAQARLYLGVARVALTQVDAAGADFKAALRLDPTLKVGEDRFSPKVVRIFEDARRELLAETKAKSKSSKTPLLVAGGVAAAGGIVVLAASGGSGPSPSPPPGSVSFTNARFQPNVILCPNGSQEEPLPFTVLVDATNGTSTALQILSVSVRMTIVASPAVPSEVGQSTTQDGTPLPSRLAAHTSTGLQIGSNLLCSNLDSGAPRYNDWSALVTLQTSAGSFNLGTTEAMRINLP